MNRESYPGVRVARPGVGGLLLAFAVAAVAGCSAGRVDEEPVIRQGERIPAVADTVRPGASEPEREGAVAEAMATCRGEICEALARGEVALGMSRAQVQAATRSVPASWRVRGSGEVTVMTASDVIRPPADAQGPLAWIQLRDGSVVRYAYFEHQGVRLVSDPGDASLEGRAEARGRRLLAEGDELVASGEWERALERYDRADVLLPAEPMVTYRIASVLDKQLRPIEALVQYRLFLHRLQLERIEARGEVAARVAEALARARERIIVLERRGG